MTVRSKVSEGEGTPGRFTPSHLRNIDVRPLHFRYSHSHTTAAFFSCPSTSPWVPSHVFLVQPVRTSKLESFEQLVRQFGRCEPERIVHVPRREVVYAESQQDGNLDTTQGHLCR